MNKTLIVTLIAIISLTQPIISANAPRELIQSFFTAYNGHEFILNPKCLGDDFDREIQKMIEAIKVQDFTTFMLHAQVAAFQAYRYCPKDEAAQLVRKVIEEIRSGEIFLHPEEHLKKIMDVIHNEIMEKPLTPQTLGTALGDIMKILLTEELPQIKFLEEEASPFLVYSNVEDFFNGILEGVSAVPFEQNKCKVDIQEDKKLLIYAFLHLIEAIKTHTKIVEALEEIYHVILSLSHIDTNCHFIELGKSIASAASTTGMIKVSYRVATHIPEFVKSIERIAMGIRSEDMREAGIGVGKIVHLVFDYSTN